MNRRVGLVIPVANEEDSIEAFCKSLIKYTAKIHGDTRIFFVVDSFSRDNTRKVLNRMAGQHPQITVIFAPGNKNVVDAYVRGYKEAIHANCDFIIEMDAGFSHLPEELYQFVDGLAEGYDCVLGVRPLWSLSYKVPLKRRLYSLGGTILANALLGTKGHDMTSGYEGFTRKAAERIIADPFRSAGHFFQTEVRYRARNLKIKEVPITYNFPSPRVRAASVINSFTTLFALAAHRWMD